jgi:hypothetical protein
MAKRKDVGESKSEPNALIAYRAPPTPSTVPTLFKTEPAVAETPETEQAGIDVAVPDSDPPVLPRAATLGEPPPAEIPTLSAAPSVVPDEAAAAAPEPVAAKPEQRPHRFTLLAASVALAASLGAIVGSLGHGEFQRQFAAAAPPPRPDVSEDVRMLKDTVAQLRANVKSLSDNMAAMRVSMTASSSTLNGQLGKIAEALDRGERRAGAAAAPAETTGSVTPANGGEVKPPKPAILDGWVVRKVYDGAALVEGRYGIVEVEPGTILPGVGRVQEIKRQDGHWVVVTPKGLIMPVH